MSRCIGALLVIGTFTLLQLGSAAAEESADLAPVRRERSIEVGATLVWPWIASHDATVPLPSLRVGANISPRLAFDLTAGVLPHEANGRWSAFDLGARWFLGDGNASPYFMGRVGAFFDKADEGSNRSYPYATVGAGFEYACRCGFVAWGEAGPALAGYTSGGPHSAAAALYGSVGLGYRFGLHRQAD